MAWARRFQQGAGHLHPLLHPSSLSLATNNSHRRAWGYLGLGILGSKGLLVGLGTPLVLWFWAGLLCSRVHLGMVGMGYGGMGISDGGGALLSSALHAFLSEIPRLDVRFTDHRRFGVSCHWLHAHTTHTRSCSMSRPSQLTKNPLLPPSDDTFIGTLPSSIDSRIDWTACPRLDAALQPAPPPSHHICISA